MSLQAFSQKKLIEVAQFGHYQPIGLAVSQTNRIFVTFPYRQPYKYGLAEVVNGETKPYPDTEWNEFDTASPANHFLNVQALWVDDKNNLWILDPGNPGGMKALPEGAKLLKVNLATDKVEKVYHFEDLKQGKNSLNDVRIDTKRKLAYLSNPGISAIVILDLATGKSRLALKDDISTTAVVGFTLHLDDKDVIDEKGNPFVSNVNGIALTKDFLYLYFKPINTTTLYRIQTAYLANDTLSTDKLSSHVEKAGEAGVTHGLISDKKGNIYLTNSPDKTIRYITPAGQVNVLVQDERLSWPDSFGIGSDGYLYVTCSQLNRTKNYNNGQDKIDYPFRMYKVKLPE